MKKENQKVVLSKELLKRAALTLKIENKKITVTSLCNKAGVSRYTFYAHYKSIEELYDEIYKKTSDDIISKIEKLDYKNISRHQLSEYIRSLEEDPRLFDIILKSNNVIDEEYKMVKEKSIEAILKSITSDNKETDELIANFVFSGIFGMIATWKNTSNSLTSADVAFLIKGIINKMVR